MFEHLIPKNSDTRPSVYWPQILSSASSLLGLWGVMCWVGVGLPLGGLLVHHGAQCGHGAVLGA